MFIIVVSLVAIGVLLVNLTSAFGYYYGWPNAVYPNGPGVAPTPGVAVKSYSADCETKYDACYYPNPQSGYVWYGPYIGLYSPAPSGTTWLACYKIGLAPYKPPGQYSAIVRTDVTANFGSVTLTSQNLYITNPVQQPYCNKFHLAASVWGNVEIRVAFLQAAGTGLYVNSVSLAAQ